MFAVDDGVADKVVVPGLKPVELVSRLLEGKIEDDILFEIMKEQSDKTIFCLQELLMGRDEYDDYHLPCAVALAVCNHQ